jgi:hypothetical protein
MPLLSAGYSTHDQQVAKLNKEILKLDASLRKQYRNGVHMGGGFLVRRTSSNSSGTRNPGDDSSSSIPSDRTSTSSRFSDGRNSNPSSSNHTTQSKKRYASNNDIGGMSTAKLSGTSRDLLRLKLTKKLSEGVNSLGAGSRPLSATSRSQFRDGNKHSNNHQHHNQESASKLPLVFFKTLSKVCRHSPSPSRYAVLRDFFNKVKGLPP